MDERKNGRASWVTEALDEFEAPLVAYASRLTRDVHAARDVVQETFLRLCAEDRSDARSHVKAWLYTVCRRIAIDELRKERRMDSPNEAVLEAAVEARPSREADPAYAVEVEDETSHVLRLMAELSANQREVLDLKFRHGLSYREIAEITGLSAGNVGFLIHVGLKTLRGRLGQRVERAAGGVR